MTTSDVSVVIVNYNSGDNLAKCIRAVLAQTMPPAEIIVVDNASTDGSQDGLPDGVRLIQLDENIGLTRARNRGIAEASGRLVMTLDDDIYPEPNSIELLLHYHSLNPGAVLCPTVVYLDTDIIQAQAAWVHFIGMLGVSRAGSPLGDSPAKPFEAGAFLGASILAEKQKLLVAGGFDELFFFYFEDMEFSLRLRRMGIPIWCVPAAVVMHEPGQGTPGLSFRTGSVYPPRRFFLNLRNRWITLCLHYSLRTVVLLGPSLLLFEISSLLVALWRGWGGLWITALREVYQFRDEIKKKRARYQSRQVTKDRDLFAGGCYLPFSKGFITNRLAKALVDLAGILMWMNWILVRRWLG